MKNMSLPTAPTVNGVMELEESEILTLREKLNLIRDNFEETVDMEYCTVHYMVSEFNADSEMQLNGDTASFIMSYMTEEEMQSQEEVVAE